MKEHRVGNTKLGLVVCIVLIVCLSAFSGWTYARINDLYKQATELETQNEQLQTQVTDLENQLSSLETEVENLTDIINNMTFTEMETEQLEIQGCTFNTDTTKSITLTVQSTGTADLTVSAYKIGTGGTPTALTTPVDMAPGQTRTVIFDYDWQSGTTYDIYLITANENQFPYRVTAP